MLIATGMTGIPPIDQSIRIVFWLDDCDAACRYLCVCAGWMGSARMVAPVWTVTIRIRAVVPVVTQV